MFDVSHIIQSGGLLLLGGFLFAEVGLFLGFFLPGDTLVIAAGIYAHEGKLSIASVIMVSALAAIAGDSVAYFIGRKLGPRVFSNPDSVIFRPDHVARAEAFFEKHGAKTLLIAHFIPVVRTFNPLLAGVAGMPYKKFLTYDVIGDIFWAVSLGLVGYYIGSRIPGIDNYILIGLGIIILITVLPTLIQFIRVRRRKSRAREHPHADTEKSGKKSNAKKDDKDDKEG